MFPFRKNKQLSDGNFLGALDYYSNAAPAPQNAADLFKDEWSSAVPGLGTGQALLFDDPRVHWLAEQCGGFADKEILELGPLEAGHTHMMSKAGAKRIVSIEANARAFMKCLIVKNALGIDAEFIHGDFRHYIADTTDRFDFAIASGVLYHMLDPGKMLQDLARVADRIGIWTHYFDADILMATKAGSLKFNTTAELHTIDGLEIGYHQQRYLTAVGWAGFCGGSSSTSNWLTRDDLLALLKHLDFAVTIGQDQPDHPNGPAILLYAERTLGS